MSGRISDMGSGEGSKWPGELCEVLGEMAEAHEELVAAARAHRAALSGADPGAMEAATLRVRDAVTQIAELEHRRVGIVQAAVRSDRVLRARDRAGEPAPRIGELAALVRADERARHEQAAVRLRGSAEAARREVSRVRLAAGSLLGHVRGLMHELAVRLGGGSTYEPRASGHVRGRASVAAPVACGIDLTH